MAIRALRASFVILIAAGLSACHARPPVAPDVAPRTAPPAPLRSTPPPPATVGTRAVPPAPAPPTLSEEERFRRMSLDELNASAPLADAFFDYDQASLREDARAALERDAQWLRKWPQTTVRISGHCDERGTAEYNLALGEKRAETVRAFLTDLGIDARRIAVTSFGREQPFCRTGAGEKCFSQNRRGHFLITGK